MTSIAKTPVKSAEKKGLKRFWKYRWLYFLLIPGILYYIFFQAAPFAYFRIIFQKYSPQLEMLGKQSPWLDPWYRNFEVFFTGKDFWMLTRNTLALAVLNIGITFPFPIILSLMLNEIRNSRFKRPVQSVLYLPHFISWAILASIVMMICGPAPTGAINTILKAGGHNTIPFLDSVQWFRPMYIIENIWKESGWGTIIYLAALSNCDPQLYEAAVIDGAGRWKQMVHVTLPAIRSTIVIMLILRIGSFLDTGFDQIYLMMNSLNREVAQVFDTYVYEVGLCGLYKPAKDISTYSYAAAIGFARSIVSTTLILITDRITKVLGEEGLL